MNAITEASGRFVTRSFAQSEIGDVAVGRGAHYGLVEIPLRRLKLGL
jgi:hypothetical protein